MHSQNYYQYSDYLSEQDLNDYVKNRLKAFRSKCYGVWEQKLQIGSLTDLITNGLHHLYRSTDAMWPKLQECMEEGITRIEISQYFYSKEEYKAAISNKTRFLKRCEQRYENMLCKINKLQIGFKVKFEDFLTVFFGKDGCQRTVVIERQTMVCIVYGYDSFNRKYFGVLKDITAGFDMKSFLRRYLLPEREYTFIQANNVAIKATNTNKNMMLPLWPMNPKVPF